MYLNLCRQEIACLYQFLTYPIINVHQNPYRIQNIDPIIYVYYWDQLSCIEVLLSISLNGQSVNGRRHIFLFKFHYLRILIHISFAVLLNTIKHRPIIEYSSHSISRVWNYGCNNVYTCRVRCCVFSMIFYKLKKITCVYREMPLNNEYSLYVI